MIGPGEANQEAILNAFQSDDVVVGHPEPHGLPPHMAPAPPYGQKIKSVRKSGNYPIPA
jgi:hypothetical protein